MTSEDVRKSAKIRRLPLISFFFFFFWGGVVSEEQLSLYQITRPRTITTYMENISRECRLTEVGKSRSGKMKS